MRLIDAEEAYKVLTDYYHQRTEIQHKALKEAIERVPIVDIDSLIAEHEGIGYEKGRRDGYAEAVTDFDAEPVRHEHWKEHKDYPGLAYLCSGCGYFTTDRSYYCPHCGAKMDEVEDETD